MVGREVTHRSAYVTACVLEKGGATPGAAVRVARGAPRRRRTWSPHLHTHTIVP